MPPEAPESHVAALPHHEDLWFEDGNIILGAVNISFRLHRGILSRHSVVFRDMLMLPQGPESPKAFGCPLVQLHDKGEHLVMLFTVLYDGVKKYVRSSLRASVLRSCSDGSALPARCSTQSIRPSSRRSGSSSRSRTSTRSSMFRTRPCAAYASASRPRLPSGTTAPAAKARSACRTTT